MDERRQSHGGAADPDRQLVERAVGELPYRTDAFGELMQRYERLIFAVCYRTLNNAADAEDVSQDIMLKVFHTLSDFGGRSSFKTWLMRVTTNTCLTYLSKRNRRNEIRAQWAESRKDEQVSHLSTADRDVSALLDTLNPEDRQVLVLRHLAGMKLAEVSEACGFSLSATKMRLYRAIEQLRKLANSYS